METYEDALKKILENIHVLEEEERFVVKSMGQVLAEDVYSGLDLPQRNSSGPDGYAVISSDIKGASKDNPSVLRVIGTSRAGHITEKTVTPGTAVRIMTGSVVPDGADCVVRFEDTDEPAGKNGPNTNYPLSVKIYIPAASGANVLPAGSNIRKGALAIAKGTIIGPAQISVLFSLGITKIRVIRRPVIAVIATGDELVMQGKPLAPGKTYNCNSAAISSMVVQYGGIPKTLGIARDNEASIRARIGKGMTADAVITTGGVSMGDFDLVRLTLGKIGKVIFSKIKMGPGASLSFGTIERTSPRREKIQIPVFALAGPPMGCLINFETLVRPAMRKMLGFEKLSHPVVDAVSLDSWSDRRAINFVKWTSLTGAEGNYRVEVNISEKLGSLASIGAANSLTIVPEGTVIKAGDRVKVLPLELYGYNMD